MPKDSQIAHRTSTKVKSIHSYLDEYIFRLHGIPTQSELSTLEDTKQYVELKLQSRNQPCTALLTDQHYFYFSERGKGTPPRHPMVSRQT